jgi:Ca2+-transporting ATPase
MRSLNDVLSLAPTHLENGLTADGAATSRKQFGSNHLTPLPREPVWRKLLEKFDEPIIEILLAAALLSIVVDLFRAHTILGGAALGTVTLLIGTTIAAARLRPWLPSLLFALAVVWVCVGAAAGHPSYEGLAVMIAVALATGVAFLSEYRSDREFDALNEKKDESLVKVTRNGQFHTVPLEEIVVGDLVTLEMGDEIPADGRPVKATEFLVDQSLLTGESEPVPKHTARPEEAGDGPEQAGCLYRGTQVVDGVAQLLVTDVGDATMIGQIAQRLTGEFESTETPTPIGQPTQAERVKSKLTISKELTPLQLKLARLARLISRVGYVAAAAIFFALLIFGLIHGEFNKGVFETIRYLLDSFVYTVIIIVVAVPEGLPMSVTVSLALAMRKMTRANSLVRQLVACETIGSVTVICSDKTGTLTRNQMQVVRIWLDHQLFEREGEWTLPDASRPWPRDGEPVDWLALDAAVNTTAHLELKEDGRLASVGNSTEGALLQWLREGGIIYQNLRLQFPPLYQIHFSSERKRMTTVIQYGQRVVALVKGAPEWIIERSTHFLGQGGAVREWTPDARLALRTALSAAAGQAMRTLAFAWSGLPDDVSVEEEALHQRRDELDRELVLIGFVAIRDPIRADVKDALAECRRAGIEVKMITGDNPETAQAIASEIGLLAKNEAIVLTHDDFEAATDGRLSEQLPRLRVLARARPMDKLRLVNLLQRQNHVVAMTGDGTNDAPALRRADVGLAMGLTGTEVAKEASKIVLLDDAFSTIVKAVHWGRSLYENIQRFVQFQLTINVSALVIAFLGPFLNIRPPFTVLQLLWINVIMDTFAAIALCSEPPRPGLMDVPPKRRDEPILTPTMKGTILITAGFFVAVMMALLYGMTHSGWFAAGSGPNPSGWDFEPLNVRQVTYFFTTYVLFQVWNQINCRSLTPERSGFAGLLNNPMFWLIASLTLVGQITIVTFGGSVFRVEPLGVWDWVIIAVATSSVLIFSEIVRYIRKSLLPRRAAL